MEAFLFYIEIPFGCEAEVILPEQESKILEAGSYDFHIRTDKDYRALYSADTPYERLFADERAVEILKNMCRRSIMEQTVKIRKQ